MARPFDSRLQEPYTVASKFIRAMDANEGGPESFFNAIRTACCALEAGLITAEIVDGSNSCFDALVMLHELRERVQSQA